MSFVEKRIHFTRVKIHTYGVVITKSKCRYKCMGLFVPGSVMLPFYTYSGIILRGRVWFDPPPAFIDRQETMCAV